jgi:hypothetical protein
VLLIVLAQASLGRNSPSEMGDRRVGTGDAVRGDRSVVVDFAPAMNALVSNVLNANSTSTTRAFSLVQFYLLSPPMERDSDSK